MPWAIKTAKPAHQPEAHDGRPWQKLYNRQSWRRESRRWRSDKLCEDCLADGKVTASKAVHHRVKHQGNETLFRDHANWMALCKRHHDQRTSRGE